jgi:hypothetical protein
MKYQSGKGLMMIMTMAGLSLFGAGRNCLGVEGGAGSNAPPTIPLINPGEVILYWTATGDDGYIGRAAGYDMRCVPYEMGPIDTGAKWALAMRLSGEPTPSPAGHIDSMLVSGLEPGASYYFCIKAYDEAGNYSTLSNSALVQAANGDFIAGDVNGSGRVTGTDVVYLVNYLEGGPPPPDPFLRADCNGNCEVNGSDVLYLLSFFRGGPPPYRGNCDMILGEKRSKAPGY